MPNTQKPHSGRRKSAGPVKKQEAVTQPEEFRYERVPPEERLPAQLGQGVAVVAKTIVVRDERGEIVSVTKVDPGAKYGVGVKPQPGQTIKEYAAGTLAEDPFAPAPKQPPKQPPQKPQQKPRRPAKGQKPGKKK